MGAIMHTRWLMRLSLTPNQSIGLVTLFSLLVYNVGFWRNVAHQVWSLAVLLLMAYGCREATLHLGLGGIDSLPRFLVS